jgi:hypothetical protein
MNSKHIQRRGRAAVLVAVSVLVAGALAGTALGATSGWQDVWNQIKPLLSDPGTINTSDNPVHWTKLKGVPAGLADGLDNGVDRAGFGLTKNLVPDVSFAVDTTKIQRRVGGTCPAGQAVQAIGADGSVACAGAGAVVYHGWDVASGGAEPIGNNWASIGAGALDLPAGTWSLVAKVSVAAGCGGCEPFVTCRLDAWENGTTYTRDVSSAVTDHPDVNEYMTVPLVGVHSSSSAFRAAVVCKDSPFGDSKHETGAVWQNVKITATQVGELHTQQLN